jgi:uncharacterized Zn finger protein
MIDLDENDIRQLCSESSFSRGEMYLEEGRVSIKEATITRIKAVVSGTEDYHVERSFISYNILISSQLLVLS